MGSAWLLWPSAIQNMASSPSSAATGSAAMWEAAMTRTPLSTPATKTCCWGPRLASRALHGVRHSDAGVDAAKDTERGQHVGIGREASLEDSGREAIKGEGRVTAQIAVEAARDPPDAAAEHESGKEEWQAQKQEDMRHLMAQFPGAQLAAGILYDAILWTAKEIESTLDEEIEGERKPGEAVGQNAVVDVAAGGVVASERRGIFPGFAAAAGVLIVAVGQRLPADEPKPLQQEGRQECCRDALRQIEAEAAKHAKAVSHHVQSKLTSLNGCVSMVAFGVVRALRAKFAVANELSIARKKESRPEQAVTKLKIESTYRVCNLLKALPIVV